MKVLAGIREGNATTSDEEEEELECTLGEGVKTAAKYLYELRDVALVHEKHY